MVGASHRGSNGHGVGGYTEAYTVKLGFDKARAAMRGVPATDKRFGCAMLVVLIRL